MYNFWPIVQNTDVTLFGMVRATFLGIGSEIYTSVDLSVLRCLRQRGMNRIRVVFNHIANALPLGFAAAGKVCLYTLIQCAKNLLKVINSQKITATLNKIEIGYAHAGRNSR